jgi:hypothetical protein
MWWDVSHVVFPAILSLKKYDAKDTIASLTVAGSVDARHKSL